MKKLFLTLVLALSTLCIWAHDVQIDDIYYNLDTSAKTAEVTFKGSTYYNVQTYSGSVTIPGTIVSDGVTFCVTSIGNYAFYNCNGLTSVMIPNSMTNIGGYTFAFCSDLTSLTIPTSVTSIGEYAFEECIGLTSIMIPNSVKRIGDYAFSRCTGLTSVTIPNSVTSIGNFVFNHCI